MLAAIKSFFEQHLNPQALKEGNASPQRAVHLAAAALMVELMETDRHLDERESQEFLRVLRQTFELEPAAVQELVDLARAEARDATSLYQFTRLINDHYDYQEKIQLIAAMWRLAFADERLDKYEESLIRQVAELIYVSHGDFIQAKLRARSGTEGPA
ncbi:MAG: hypothetical protein RLZZ385_2241 [Pseudomonadota bacterium]|jgi:uncharacterized tellurite resistance protein B-like protein